MNSQLADEYKEIELYLQQAQIDLGQALSNLTVHYEKNQTTDSSQNVDEEVSSYCHQIADKEKTIKPVDFKCIFAQHNLLHEDTTETSVEESWNHTLPSLRNRPKAERPKTLTPPPVLPSSGRYKNQHWKFYVHNDMHKSPKPLVRNRIKTRAIMDVPATKNSPVSIWTTSEFSDRSGKIQNNCPQTVISDALTSPKSEKKFPVNEQNSCMQTINSDVLVSPETGKKFPANGSIGTTNHINGGSRIKTTEDTCSFSVEKEKPKDSSQKNSLSAFTKILKQSQRFLNRASSASPEPCSKPRDFVDTGSLKITKSERKSFRMSKFYKGSKSETKVKKKDVEMKKEEKKVSVQSSHNSYPDLGPEINHKGHLSSKDQQYTKNKMNFPTQSTTFSPNNVDILDYNKPVLISPPLSPNLEKIGLNLEKYKIRREGDHTDVPDTSQESSPINRTKSDKSDLVQVKKEILVKVDVHVSCDTNGNSVSNKPRKKHKSRVRMPPIAENMSDSDGADSTGCSSLDSRVSHLRHPSSSSSGMTSVSDGSHSPSSCNNSGVTASLNNGNHSVPTRTSSDLTLLDALHKKYYPDQYSQDRFLSHEYGDTLSLPSRLSLTGHTNTKQRGRNLETCSLDRKSTRKKRTVNAYGNRPYDDSTECLVIANLHLGQDFAEGSSILARKHNAASNKELRASVSNHFSNNSLQNLARPKKLSNGSERVEREEQNNNNKRCLDKINKSSTLSVNYDLKVKELIDGETRKKRSSSCRGRSSCVQENIPECLPVPKVTIEMTNNKNLPNKKELAEIEAVEACDWLRAAGFPQYAQMYEDLLFPIEISSVEKDHEFLDRDSLQSLFRRLNVLNKCASMKIDAPSRKVMEDSDEDDQCALSDKWHFQRSSRRWSRCDLELDLSSPCSPSQSSPKEESAHHQQGGMKSCSSHDSVLTDDSPSPQEQSPVMKEKTRHLEIELVIPDSPTDESFHTPMTDSTSPGLGAFTPSPATTPTSPRFQRSASERMKGAKNFLKRMESLTSSKRKKPQSPTGRVEIGSPVVIDATEMKLKLDRLNCMELSPAAESSPVPGLRSGTRSSRRNKSDADGSPMLYKRGGRVFSDTSSSSYYSAYSTFSDSDDIAKVQNMGSDLRTRLDSASFSNSELDSDNSENRSPVCSNGHFEMSNGSQVNDRLGSLNLGSDSDTYKTQYNEMNQRRCQQSESNDSRRNLENRVSIYDNLSSSPDTNPTLELDRILQDLLQSINGLSRSLGEGETDEATLLNNLSSQDPIPQTVHTFDTAPVSVDSDILDTTQDESFDSQIREFKELDSTAEMETDRISASSSNHDAEAELSDGDVVDGESSQDSPKMQEKRERRDSGVGSSLTRSTNDKPKPRIRWHSFVKSHRPSLNSRSLQIGSMSAGQLLILHKLCLLKVTSLMEKYSPSNRSGWNWVMPKFIRRVKTPDYSEKNVFGVPLLVILQRTGQPLPQCLLYAMRCLRRTASDAVGIFRKSGVRSRIQKLRNQIEADPDSVDFESLQAYDVADLVKQYFRELPECLLTNKLSETFITIFTYVPTEHRLDGIQAAIMLLPDENREVLQCLLLFLSDLAQYSQYNQMTASNLAVCFAPSLFHLVGNQGSSPKRNRKNIGVPDPRELQEQKAAHECLTLMITESKQIFKIPEEMLGRCRFSYLEQGDPVTLEEISQRGIGDKGYKSYIESCIQGLLKESREKFKGWVTVPGPELAEVAYKKVGDGHPLRLWKCCVDVEAPPVEVLNRVLRERHLWDEDILNWKVLEKLDSNAEIFQYACNSLAPHPTRDYTELRSWKTDLPKGACVLVSASINQPEAPPMGGVTGVVLASRYLIEPCGSGKSRLTHIYRIDTRGRTPEWYNKVYGYLGAMYMSRISSSFKQSINSTEGPETKV